MYVLLTIFYCSKLQYSSFYKKSSNMHVPKNFVDVYLKILKYSGLWPPVEKRAMFYYYLFFLPFFFVFSVLQNIAATIEIVRTGDQFRVTIFNIAILVLPVLTTFRVIHYLLNIDGYRKIMQLLKRKSFDFKNFFDIDFDFEELLRKRKSVKPESYEEIRQFWKSMVCNQSKAQ